MARPVAQAGALVTLPVVGGLDQPLGGWDDVFDGDALAPDEALGSPHDLPDQGHAALCLYARVLRRVHGDGVAALQLQVLYRVAGHGFAQVEGNDPRAQCHRVQPVDGGVVKVDLWAGVVGVGGALIDLLPVATRNEHAPVGHDVSHPHAGAPVVAHGVGDVALYSDDAGNLRADGEDGDHVAGLQRQGLALGVKSDVFNVAGHVAGLVNALQLGPLRQCQGRQAAGEREQLPDRLALVDLVNRRHVHRTQDGDPGPGWGYVDHVAGDQGSIPAGVALGEEGVHVHRGDGLAAAAQLDGAQAAVAVGAAGLEERVDQSR